MTTRIAILGGLLLAALISPVFADKDKDEKKDRDRPSAKVYQTPQAVFDAYVAASQKDDYKTMLQTMAPQAQKEAAAQVGILFGAERMELEALAKEKDKSKEARGRARAFELIFAVMDGHGVTVKVLEGVENSKDPQERAKAKKAILAVVKDPEKFVVEMLTAFALLPRGEKPKVEEKLTDLKIDGDKASGTLVRTITTKDSKEKVTKEPVEFVKIEGSWRIIPTMDFDDKK